MSENDDLIKVQLKLILNEIELLKSEMRLNNANKFQISNTDTYTFKNISQIYIEIICRMCKDKCKVVNLETYKKHRICMSCQVKLVENYESDDENIQ